MALRGVRNSDGYLIKSLPSGHPFPLEYGLQPEFKAANVTTLNEAFQFSVNRFGDQCCLATRCLLAREQQEVNGRIMEKLEHGEYTWETYNQVSESVHNVGLGVRMRGINPLDRVVVFAETRAEWLIAALGCLQHRITVVTVYSNLPDYAVAHCINETEVSLLFTSYNLLPRFERILPQCPKVTTIVVMEDQLEGIGDYSTISTSVTIVPFNDLERPNPQSVLVDIPAPEGEDVAILMYTSGSTGTPKGVELTHTNILASMIAFSTQVLVGPEDRYLAFLPLAHIIELATEVTTLALGATIYYSSPFTLTNTSTKVKAGCVGDSRKAKPTFFVSVPLLLERIIKGVKQKVETQGRLKSSIFKAALKISKHIPALSGLTDRIVFKRVQEEFGGHLKLIAVGGAPISVDIIRDMKTIFNITVQVGYGATETAASCTSMDGDETVLGHTGAPNVGVFLKLEDWEEGGYRTTDRPNSRGEIIVGGSFIAKGYYKMPEATEAAFFDENGIRWFRTGDIGEIDSRGCVTIIDRKKDLVKLNTGEYVALSNLECKLKTLPDVDNICVIADSTKSCVVAVVVVLLETLQKVASSLYIKHDNLIGEELCNNSQIKGAILKQLQSHGTRCGLNRREVPADITLTTEPWTPDSGLVTASLKLKRRPIIQHFQHNITNMYSNLD
ncbi:hypothetical protein Pmani_029398 [Petrolisthes manimaculis]|uniref:long-chain-fatty-acid--CoA ligase n=1 Tax=Petrolisthes manimaculis TaxID=1843537 RepID=A0AAE1P090_9EUCA|nr:hypothetical protein Pmani_029398 [Petrolisthes manimaculis]